MIDFRCHRLTARFFSPDGSQEITRDFEVRSDPLLGYTARVVPGVSLPKADEAALARFQQPDPACPFCLPRREQVATSISPAISSEPRIRVGSSLLFPNLLPYSQYAAVSVFSDAHWLALPDFTASLLADNLNAALTYIRAVYRFDSNARWCSYNINYLYPSGGSLPHSHSQIFVDPDPTTMQRMQFQAAEQYWNAHSRCYWDDLVQEERRRKERFVGCIGASHWFTAFAPLGFNDVRAVVAGREHLLQLTAEDVRSLAEGISRVLRWYQSIQQNSFNLALYSGPLDGSRAFRVHLTMLTRSALLPYYRSDATYVERLHWEPTVNRAPEEIASDLRAFAFS